MKKRIRLNESDLDLLYSEEPLYKILKDNVYARLRDKWGNREEVDYDNFDNFSENIYDEVKNSREMKLIARLFNIDWNLARRHKREAYKVDELSKSYDLSADELHTLSTSLRKTKQMLSGKEYHNVVSLLKKALKINYNPLNPNFILKDRFNPESLHNVEPVQEQPERIKYYVPDETPIVPRKPNRILLEKIDEYQYKIKELDDLLKNSCDSKFNELQKDPFFKNLLENKYSVYNHLFDWLNHYLYSARNCANQLASLEMNIKVELNYDIKYEVPGEKPKIMHRPSRTTSGKIDECQDKIEELAGLLNTCDSTGIDVTRLFNKLQKNPFLKNLLDKKLPRYNSLFKTMGLCLFNARVYANQLADCIADHPLAHPRIRVRNAIDRMSLNDRNRIIKG